MVAVGLGALDATDAGTLRTLAWAGTGVAVLLLAVGPALRAFAPVHLAVALLGALLLLRHDTRLLLAPVYGPGLLIAEELAARSIELRDAGSVGPGALGARAAAVLSVAALSGCAAAVAAVAVTAGPGRSIALTAVATVAVLAVYGAIAWHARRTYPVRGVEGGFARGQRSRPGVDRARSA